MNKPTQIVATTDTPDASPSVRPTCVTMRYRLQQRRAPIIIGVAGDSGSGKTTYCNGIRRLLGLDLVSTICTDGYHKEDREQRKKTNANVVIKICQSQIQQWARHSFNGKLPNNCYRVELILEAGGIPLPTYPYLLTLGQS